MAKRCTKTRDLEVHHKNVRAGNDLGNAEVLCESCHANTSTYRRSGHEPPPDFSEKTKILARKRAGEQCECTREHCH
jgi:hypothetical protein